MLPDLLHELSTEDRFSYAKLLAHLSRIDGELTFEEMALFESRLGTAMLPPTMRKQIRKYLKQPPSLESALKDMSQKAGRLALRDSVLMSAIDGEIDDDELKTLYIIAEKFDMDNSSITLLVEWCQRGWTWMKEGLELLELED
jgi:uncharacterized tellurite resistance protein B-like protein